MKKNLLSSSLLHRIALLALCFSTICVGLANDKAPRDTDTFAVGVDHALNKGTRGTGTWNQRARILMAGGGNPPVASVMLHMNRPLSLFELEVLQSALLRSDLTSRQIVATAIRTLGKGPMTAAALEILATEYENGVANNWKFEAYHDNNSEAEHPYYFEITNEAVIPQDKFEGVKDVLGQNENPDGKEALKQAFKNDATVKNIFKLN